MVRLYQDDRSFLFRALELAQQVLPKESLGAILQARPFGFAIDLAALASTRDMLNLELWLKQRVAEHGHPFVLAVLSYIEDNTDYADQSEPAQQQAASQKPVHALSKQTIQSFLKVLDENVQALPADVAARLQRLHHHFPQVPRVSARATTLAGHACTDGVLAVGQRGRD
jgi:CCR4-NOT transcription complex subunit 1